jgi:hypothetical protein
MPTEPIRRRSFQTLLVLIILMLTAGAGGQAVSIVAEVNGAPITRQRFQVDYRQAVNDYARKGNPINEAYLRNLRARLIDYLVETELLLQDARRKGVAVTDQELDRILAAERSTARGEAEISAGLEAVGWTGTSTVKDAARRSSSKSLSASTSPGMSSSAIRTWKNIMPRIPSGSGFPSAST